MGDDPELLELQRRLIQLGDKLYAAEQAFDQTRGTLLALLNSRRYRLASAPGRAQSAWRAIPDENVLQRLHAAASAARHGATAIPEWIRNPDPPQLHPAGVSRPPARTVIVIDKRQVRPDVSAGLARTLDVIHALQDLNYHVIFAFLDQLRHEPWSTDLETEGVEVYAGLDNLHGATLDLSPAAIIVVYLDVAQVAVGRLRSWFAEAPILYDTIDLQFVRKQREQAVSGHIDDDLVEDLKRLERTVADEVDVVLTVSREEADVVATLAPKSVTHILPLTYPARSVPPPGPNDREATVVFVGNFEHAPNVDASIFLAKEIMPLVWRERAAKLHLIGPGAPEEVKRLAASDVHVLGRVPALDPFLDRARVSVSPLRFGAGVKGKVVQALMAGIPVVTTPVGAEGLDLTDGTHALIRDSSGPIANAILDVLRDDDLWWSLSSSGRRHAESHNGRSALLGALDEALRLARKHPRFLELASAR